MSQSPTQWPPLTSRIDICQRLTVLQNSCKIQLCSRICFVYAIFHFAYIFCCYIKYNIISWGENNVWNWQYIYICIHPIEWKQWSELLKIMTRTSCLRTVKFNIFLIFIWEERRSFWCSSVILLNALTNSVHDQPLRQLSIGDCIMSIRYFYFKWRHYRMTSHPFHCDVSMGNRKRVQTLFIQATVSHAF